MTDATNDDIPTEKTITNAMFMTMAAISTICSLIVFGCFMYVLWGSEFSLVLKIGITAGVVGAETFRQGRNAQKKLVNDQRQDFVSQFFKKQVFKVD